MPKFKQYLRTNIAEIRPVSAYEVDNGLDDSSISVSEADMLSGSPLPGDMVARNPQNHSDQWLIAADYFADNFMLKAPDEATN